MNSVINKWTFIVLSGLFFVICVRSAAVTDSSGNTAYDNGTISWGPVPGESIQYKTNTTYTSGSLRLLFDFARSFLGTVQSKPFPFGKCSDNRMKKRSTKNILNERCLF